MSSSQQYTRWLSYFFALCVAILILLYATVPQDASPEYTYTVTLLSQWGVPPLLLFALMARRSLVLFLLSFVRCHWKIVAFLGIVLLAIPFLAPPAGQLSWRLGYALSACWMAGTLCIGFVFFVTAAKINNALSGLLCLIGSLLLAFSFMEGYLLLTAQAEDALLDDSLHSKYVLTKQATPVGSNVHSTAIGDFPKAGAPLSTAHRLVKFDRELFDVRYGFDAQGRRVTPPPSKNAQTELLAFGCSYTFGHSLEDKDTWPWQLGMLLGEQWRVSNYAYNGFGPQQMLSLLEEGSIETYPASKRIALFLAIHQQVRRIAGLQPLQSIHYTLRENGQLKRDGFTTDTPYTTLFLLPKYFNGSQLARRISILMTQHFAKKHHETFIKTYTAIIEKSARLLREKYNASLVVLLWPNIEYLEEDLRQHGITTVRIRNFLSHWDDTTKGTTYYIDPELDMHPNAKASHELAEGLAAYFRSHATQQEQ